MKRRAGFDSYFLHLDRYQTAPDAQGPVAPVLESFTAGLEALPGDDLLGGAPGAAGEAPDAEWFPVLVRAPFGISSGVAGDLGVGPTDFKETARVGDVVSGLATRAGVEALEAIPGLRVEASRECGSLELDASLSTVKGADVIEAPGAEDGAHCLLAVVDGGIDVVHEAFRDDRGQSRILCVWDQYGTGKPPAGFGYGTLHDAAAIARALATGAAPPGLARTGEGPAHGTHVASIGAGRRLRGPAEPDSVFAGGMARGAKLVVVVAKLDSQPGDPVSIGYSKGHVDALAFIRDIAEQQALPVVVNLSAGMDAGAHDGSSTLEAAFDAFTSSGRAPGRAIVKSAGNSREARRHARLEIPAGAPKRTVLLPVGSTRASSTLEAWFSSADELTCRVRVHPPGVGGGGWSPICSDADPAPKVVEPAGVVLTLDRFHVDNGDSRLLVSLPAGRAFEVELFGKQIRAAGEVQVWLEGKHVFEKGEETDQTLTVPGTAGTVITVAASGREDLGTATFSSVGPTRDGRRKPELAAPGDGIRAARAGTLREAIAMSGTSMAAPHVAGAIALLFSRERREGRPLPNAAQVRAALVATATGMNGTWNRERGYGVLDVAGLLAAW